MPRRLIAACGLVALLAACGGTGTAATVNGVDIFAADLEQVVTDFAAVGETQIIAGAADGETVRGLLTSLIRAEVTNQVLADADTSVTNADRDEVRAQLDEEGAAELPATLVDLIVELNAAGNALGRLSAPSPVEAERRYTENPKSLGMLCVRHLVVDSQDLARQARREVGDAPSDTQFATVAGKYSIEPNAKQTGGALSGRSGECISINEYQAGFDPAFVGGALEARVGVPTQPVKSSFGWHVIYVRPFSAVAESVANNLNEAAGEYLLLGALAEANISVASRYGKWNPISGQVVAP